MPTENSAVGQALPRRKGRPKKSESIALHREIVKCTQNGTYPSHREIADKVQCSKTTVVEVLAKYGINQQELEEYRENQADILLGIQRKISVNVTEDEIKAASLRDKMVGLGIAIDKHRLITGASTSNMASWIVVVQQSHNRLNSNAPVDVTPDPD
jgi:hypothetical protein